MTRATFNGLKPRTVAGGIVLPWSRQLLTPICGPSKVRVDVRKAAIDFDTLSALAAIPAYSSVEQIDLNRSEANGPGDWYNGGRSGFPIEGPYLVYHVNKPGMLAQIGEGGSFTEPFNLIGSYDQGDRCEWVFDLGLRRPIFLPYPGTLEVMGNLPGEWDFNVWKMELSRQAEWPSPIDSEVTLTAQIAQAVGGVALSSRLFAGIPTGAHSFTYRDGGVAAGVFPTVQIWKDNTGKKQAGPGGSVLDGKPTLVDFNNQSSQFYGRWGLANATALLVASSAAAVTGEIQFHISIT